MNRKFPEWVNQRLQYHDAIYYNPQINSYTRGAAGKRIENDVLLSKVQDIIISYFLGLTYAKNKSTGIISVQVYFMCPNDNQVKSLVKTSKTKFTATILICEALSGAIK
jgi:hypothetical protein